MMDWSRPKRRRIGALIVVGWFSAPVIAFYLGGVLIAAAAIVTALILAIVAYSIFAELCENDPLGQKVLNFATATGTGIGFSLFGLILTAVLVTFVLQFASSGTLPEIFAYAEGRRLTYFEQFLLLIIFANGLAGAGLEATKRRWSFGQGRILQTRTLPNLNRKLDRMSGRLVTVSIYIAAMLLLLLVAIVFAKTIEVLPAFALDSIRIPFLAVVVVSAVPATLCGAVAFLVIIPLRLSLTVRLLWRLSFRGDPRSSRR